MTKRMICTILALVLCFSLAISVSAAEKDTAFVIDEVGYLTDSGIAALNNLGSVYYDMTGVGIFFVYTKAESLEDYDVKAILNGITDYVIMMENDTSWYVHVSGKGEIIDVAAEDALRAAYDAAYNLPHASDLCKWRGRRKNGWICKVEGKDGFGR